MRMEDFGLSPKTVLRFLAATEDMKSLYSLTVVKDGRTLLDRYFKPFHRELYRDLYSVSKSVVSLAVGVAVDQGKLRLEDRPADFFAEELPEEYDPRVKDITVRNLLNMSASSAYTSNTFRGKDCNWRTLYLGLPLPDDPGKAFHYDTGAPYMLACMVSKAMGQPCGQVLKSYVFEPMGIKDCVWSTDPEGNITGGWDCFMRAGDYVRLGQLILNLGSWNGEQLISQEYMSEAVSELIPTLDDPGVGWCYGYGFLFWRWPDDTFGCFGAFGQLIICSPRKNLYVATTAGLSIEDNRRLALAVIETLVGEAQRQPLKRDDLAYRQLCEALESRDMEYPRGESRMEAVERGGFDSLWRFPDNDSGIEALSFKRLDDRTIQVKMGWHGRDVQFRAGYQMWTEEKLDLGHEILQDHAFAYAWTSGNTLVMRHYLLNTAYVKTYTLSFEGGKVRLTVTQNVVIPGAEAGVEVESR